MTARPRRSFDPFRPQAWMVERERADTGEVVSVATLFLTNRECPWRCIYCDLWKGATSDTVPVGAIPAQIDFALAQPGVDAAHHIKLYNAGSFFDSKAIPPEDWPAIARRVGKFKRVIVECHPALVGRGVAEFLGLLREVNPTTHLEVAMGLEIADDEILARLKKRMTRKSFAAAAEKLKDAGAALRVFVMVQPPYSGGEAQALAHAEASVCFAFDCGATVVTLIPARPADGLREASENGEFTQPRIQTLELAFAAALQIGRGRVFVDLWDLEKFAECAECLPSRRARLERMNHDQSVLPEVSCRCANAVGSPQS